MATRWWQKWSQEERLWLGHGRLLESALGTDGPASAGSPRHVNSGHGGRSPTRGITEPIGWRHAGGRCRAAPVEEAKGRASKILALSDEDAMVPAAHLTPAIHHTLSLCVYICTYKTLTILLQGEGRAANKRRRPIRQGELPSHLSSILNDLRVFKNNWLI